MNLRLRYSILNPLIFVLTLWSVKNFEEFFDVSYVQWGILPRTLIGLRGVLTAPLIHGDYPHLISNSFPIVFLGTTIYYFYSKVANKAIFFMYILTNILVWCFARQSFHIGASGLVYSLASFLFWSGLFRGERRSLAISLIIILLYGGLFYGALPSDPGMSWETHLFGGTIGLILAFVYRKVRVWDEEEVRASASTDFRKPNGNVIYKPSHYRQNTNTLMMIRPKNFGYNAETSESNVFQNSNELANTIDVSTRAVEEFDSLALKLRNAGINVVVFEDNPSPVCPDAVFPNNWISFHHDGQIVNYSLQAENRRKEVREDVDDILAHKYGFAYTNKLDLTPFSESGKFLEGTGSIVFDHQYKLAYANVSSRTDPELLGDLCQKMNYNPILFKAQTSGNQEIYHTNVVMSVGQGFVVVCLDVMPDELQRKQLMEVFNMTKKEVIAITEEQMFNFCGNILQVENVYGKKYLVMSVKAFESFTPQQKEQLSRHGETIHSNLTNIEYYGGGSARCMLAEVFLPRG